MSGLDARLRSLQFERLKASLGSSLVALGGGAGDAVRPSSIVDILNQDMRSGTHLFYSDSTSKIGATSGFVSFLLLHAALKSRRIVWVQRSGPKEWGQIYGPGVEEMGGSPNDWISVLPDGQNHAIWAVEEALGSSAVGAVVAEIGDLRALDLTATRRIALRSEQSGVPVYWVGIGRPGHTAARTHWNIEPAKSEPQPLFASLLGDPEWVAALMKNRRGRCGAQRVGFSWRTGGFVEARLSQTLLRKEQKVNKSERVVLDFPQARLRGGRVR
ncbi:hypothetical protein [Acuticoccus kandeliae]|uniref:hypothetical protein n=1 Tax=Acuticoccus kandeliae TaxID=2073160 RepID=UPI000D3ED891|nr:hypothetical protein [Acuticoccus kandeliae]